jgi:hypothetical protein
MIYDMIYSWYDDDSDRINVTITMETLKQNIRWISTEDGATNSPQTDSSSNKVPMLGARRKDAGHFERDNRKVRKLFCLKTALCVAH